MALCTTKLTEMPFHNSSIPLRSHCFTYNFFFSSSSFKPSFPLLKPFSSISSALRTTEHNYRSSRPRQNPNNHYKKSSAPSWRTTNSSAEKRKLDSDFKDVVENQSENRNGDRGRGAIERIVHRLRNLGLGSDDEKEEEEDVDDGNAYTGEEKLGDLLQRKWGRPDSFIDDDDEDDEDDRMLLPWERGEDERQVEEGGVLKKKRVKAPTYAELTIEDAELRRLRTLGMTLRERINIPKAGVTQLIVEKIHDQWRKSELVRLKFHESLAHDMRTAHAIVEDRTRGLVIWRSGSVMVVYRGSTYQRPSSSKSVHKETVDFFVPDVSSAGRPIIKNDNNAVSVSERRESSAVDPDSVENMTAEEIEYKDLLSGLGPRFHDWWGTGLLPVDADLLPPTIPGYKTPFRLLPTGMRSRLTNAEMTNLRKLAKSLPCHFALGRNRNHQGLASAIVKLWAKSLVAKIAVKRGIQNTNNKLMAEDIKKLTGGTLLLRNKYYIVIYRGKDFLPASVEAALMERHELTKEIQDTEEKVRAVAFEHPTHLETTTGTALAGTLAEFHEAQARWGREISAEEHMQMKEEAVKAKNARVVKKIEHKLDVAQAKMLRAEKLLSKIEASMIPVGPSDDQETITDEEKFMYRRVGLRMKAYLPLGIRGVFDGVIENMHLHWKHRELVKLISKQKTLAFVEDTARLLEYESGGILVAIERVPKGYALIYYRGKNYQRPISLRPRNLLTKAKALKRSVAMQRHEALSQHISELERTIDQMKSEITGTKCQAQLSRPICYMSTNLLPSVVTGEDAFSEISYGAVNRSRFDRVSMSAQMDNEDSSMESEDEGDDYDDDEGDDYNDDEDDDDDSDEEEFDESRY
ncbi:hypothetical protein C5167_050316 [Papaver somniferum]|uniref:CRM domain-containing protein n=1 Tax=Papaver somniferum TaxID=3469 RepID=A0A4Y7KNB7_PAPSO|nr:hypothetical protein C5167_050316 [Papaver somniferum]